MCVAGLGIEDPTKPVYMTNNISVGEDVSIEEIINPISAIPPLNQLIYSVKRKVAVFGDTIVMSGDITDFGKIIEIQKDRVIVQSDGQIMEVVFYEENSLEQIN